MKQPEYKDMVDAWVDAHAGQMLEDLKELIRIPSVKGAPKEDMPYGEMPARAVCAMQKLMERYGLRTTNYENRLAAGDLDADGEKTLDILAHLDVVPVSDKWTKTEPFEPLVEGERIYGRGTSDDKGPAVAALYALRCIRELGFGLKHGVRLVCGSDEENGSDDLVHYYSREKEALYTFSPDADYPLINVEKGRLKSSFSAKVSMQDQQDAASGQGVRVRSLHAGSAVNIVPGSGTMVLSGASERMLLSAKEETEEAVEAAWKKQAAGGLPGTPKEAGYSISLAKQDGRDLVTVEGVSAHAASPDGGINSLTVMLEFLKHLDLADAPGENLLLAIGSLWPHGEFHGESLGVDCSDEESGRLTMSLDILSYELPEDGRFCRVEGTFDCRAPRCCTDENLTRKIRERLGEAGLQMKEERMVPGHYVSADSELVTKLLESYELYFGKKGTPLAIGGGTYVHGLERGVAFGCAAADVDNRMHGDDEFMEIPMLIRSTKIFADAIIRLCG